MDFESGLLLVNSPRILADGCLLFFLSAMTLVCVSNHLGLLWVAIEATTLASAPMIYFHRRRQSLEAAWKYLLICSIGIALALFGNFLLAVSTSIVTGGEMPLLLDHLLRKAPQFQPQWLKAAFIFLLVGYGTKMGLAPLHTWLPDAHSESPSFVSALLSGALLNCAFLGILRAQQILDRRRSCALSDRNFWSDSDCFPWDLPPRSSCSSRISSACWPTPAWSIWEFWRWASDLGGAAVFGAMFHAVNHSLTKGMLFLVAGNILATMRTKIDVGNPRNVASHPRFGGHVDGGFSGDYWIAAFWHVSERIHHPQVRD